MSHPALVADADHVCPDEFAHIHPQTSGDRGRESLSTIVRIADLVGCADTKTPLAFREENLAKDLKPYNPNQQSDPGRSADPGSGDKHFHYYDQRTFVHSDNESDDEQGASTPLLGSRPPMHGWRKVALFVVATVAIVCAITYFISPVKPVTSASFADSPPTSCLGHWSYAPSLEQAMDVYVTNSGDRAFNVAITKVAASDATSDFQTSSTLAMDINDTTVNDVITKAILHDGSGNNTLECHANGARLSYSGQTFMLQHVDTDLKGTVAAKGWQWPIALDPNIVTASACEGTWLLDLNGNEVVFDIERKDNFYTAQFITQASLDAPKVMTKDGDATHLTVSWPDSKFNMTCSPMGAGADAGDGKPPVMMTRLSPKVFARIIRKWTAMSEAGGEATPSGDEQPRMGGDANGNIDGGAVHFE